MNNLEFIRKLYNGKNCYSDPMTAEEIGLIHINSRIESIIEKLVLSHKVIFLTGNPGDGKTYIIKTLDEAVHKVNAYVESDINSVPDLNKVINEIVDCYRNSRACLIAVNEYPFLKLTQGLKRLAPDIYKELINVKKNSIVYDLPKYNADKLFIIDLNERNLLDKDSSLVNEILKKLEVLLSSSKGINKQLDYNLCSLENDFIKEQLLELFGLASIGGEHFAIRDILGAISYMITACIREDGDDNQSLAYYDALFSGSNGLLEYLKRFDPIFLSRPSLDEAIWNGDSLEGWQIAVPETWPKDFENVEEATACFKSLKRRYYFENTCAADLCLLQHREYLQCSDIFKNIDTKKKVIKEDIVRSINKLFLPSDDDKKILRIWTTHSYDLSRETSAAVSSRYIDTSELDILSPRPADWLKGMEYTPSHILIKPKARSSPVLVLDIDFLCILFNIKSGYPVGLLSSQYEQAASIFLKQLDDDGLTEEYEDGEIIIANRSKSYKKSIFIENNKYSFDEGGNN